MRLGDNLLTTQELADMLKTSKRSLYNHLKNGPSVHSVIDPRQIQDIWIFGKRFWSKDCVIELFKEAGHPLPKESA